MTPPRGVILGVPIAIGSLVVGSGLAWIVAIQFTSGKASGARVHVEVTAAPLADQGACDPIPTLVARLDDLGLEPSPRGNGLDFTLPGLDDDRAHMPGVLGAQGDLAVDGVVMRPNHAGVQISLQGGAVTLLTLNSVVSATATATIDGEKVEIVQRNGGELQLAAWAAGSSDALRLATDRAVTLRHPLPCRLTLGPLEDVSDHPSPGVGAGGS
ncbi:MAG: hypothetical protein EXR69_05305 [Myxococcales bacterium]|nr:hypothetical protein [Myxococcales bacterium]